jgi:hypothetical protein
MECPNCGLLSPESSRRCDCGFDFSSARVGRSFRGDSAWKNGWSACVGDLGRILRALGTPIRSKVFVVWTAVLALVAMGLYPPWVNRFEPRLNLPQEVRSYDWLSGPQISGWTYRGTTLYPQDWRSEIDTPRLIVQCLIVALLAGAALWTMRDRP